MSKIAVLALSFPDATSASKMEVFVLRDRETMGDKHPHERNFAGPSLVVRETGPMGVNSVEYDIDDPRPWAHLGHLYNRCSLHGSKVLCKGVTGEDGYYAGPQGTARSVVRKGG